MKDEDAMRRAVDHIFLPSKLPQSEEEPAVDVALVKITLQALNSLRELLLPAGVNTALENATALLQKLKTVHSLRDGWVDQRHLHRLLMELSEDQPLAVRINAQNAAVLVTKKNSELILEAFELSPKNSAVMSCTGRLIRDFPGVAIAVNASLLAESDFANTIASTLCTLAHQNVAGAQQTSKKAGSQHAEQRDTADPAAVTELLFGFLRGLESTTTAVTSITKHMKDEVLWHDAMGPWRRSSMWTLIRVALQLVITRSFTGSRQLYKEIMVYVMSYILQLMHSSRGDIIFAMSAKISRRAHKLSNTANILPASVMASVRHVLEIASKDIAGRWTEVQGGESKDMHLAELAYLDFEQDTLVTLPALDKHIAAASFRSSDAASPFTPSSQLLKFLPDILPVLPKNNSDDAYYAAANLHHFELWVSHHLAPWLSQNNSEDLCEKLYGLLKQYHYLATSKYGGDPEMQSVMILTIFELWIACDQTATQTCPLLADFDPGITATALQNLLLPFLDQMNRLRQVEEYLRGRVSKSTKVTASLYSMNATGFANMFFAQSTLHKTLLAKIETEAAKAREAKVKELEGLTAEYRRLDNLHAQSRCEYTTKVIDKWCHPPETEEVHSRDCKKCSYRSQRDRLAIRVHEWPLPSDASRARAVVFELRVPSTLAYWRDARSFLLQDVLGGTRTQLQPQTIYRLSSNDPHLTLPHFQQSSAHRIDLLSQTKPCINTHYKSKQVATLSKSDVCQPNGLQYDYYDSFSDTSMGEFAFDHTVTRACTYTLSHTSLQGFISRTASMPNGPRPNIVVATQDLCPHNMALEEYKELATIPLGRRLQWANIMLQLAMPSVDFKKTDTSLVILQCIYQAGSPKKHGSLRKSHQFLNSSANAVALVQNLTQALQRIKENWESAQALRIFIAIAARTLSLSSSEVVQTLCLSFLSTAREVAVRWAETLRKKAFAADQQHDRNAFVMKSVEVALICTSTFDVDDEHIGGVLETDATVLLQSSIVIQEGEHSQNIGKDENLVVLASRYKRLLHRIYQRLAAPELHAQLNSAVRRSWPHYTPGTGGWSPVSDTADHWMTTDTEATTATPAMSVHFNLLDGELLVNGLPLDQPPRSYRENALYRTLFGNAAVEVMPFIAPGIQFSTKRMFGDGFAVLLGMNENVLTVRAMKDGRTYETVPSSVLKGYPSHFEYEYIHWLDVADDIVHFEPKEHPWPASSSGTWTLSRTVENLAWGLAQAGSFVAGLDSATSRHISRVLEPLAEPPSIHNILRPAEDGAILCVDIPTIRIGFYLSKSSSLLRSREYSSMIVDRDQSSGTLIGLQNKLLLRPAQHDGLCYGSRIILIPHSNSVGYARQNEHVHVSVSRSSISEVHALSIDTELGRLVDNGDIGCKLYLAYLHALTSYCLVDPLTQMTGTEQALSILSGAAVQSFDRLSSTQIHTLSQLASLSPGRSYYPRGKQVMQTVHWDSQLSFMSQHGRFRTAVKYLLDKAQNGNVWSHNAESTFKYPILKEIDQHLLDRDNTRAAVFHVSGFGAEGHSACEDVWYAARDRDMLSIRAVKAASMSAFMYRDGIELPESPSASGYIWSSSTLYESIQSSNAAIVPQSKAKYHADVLSTGHDTVMQNFPAFHRWLCSRESKAHRFSIMVWLSTLASASNLDSDVMQVVGLLFKAPSLARVVIPEGNLFMPQDGVQCLTTVLRGLVERHRKPMEACPEYHTERLHNERLRDYTYRCETSWRQASDSVVNLFIATLSSQWPCEQPVNPRTTGQSTYINVDGAMEAVRRRFKIWHDNTRLNDYYSRIEDIVSEFGMESVHTATPSRNVQASDADLSVPGYITEQDLFSKPPSGLTTNCHSFELPLPRQRTSGRKSELLLNSLVITLQNTLATSKFGKKYVSELDDSLDALQTRNDGCPSISVPSADLEAHCNRCGQHLQAIYAEMRAMLSISMEQWSEIHSPRVSPTFFLRQLARSRWTKLSTGWQECIVNYGLGITALQRAKRLLKLSHPSRMHDLVAELRNSGHKNWDPMEYPESLLIEVESGIMIRDVQEYIAAQMRSPPGGDNAVMQLNMGEGKSSVIVPITAAALAGSTGKQLVRVIVAKPQSKQMAQMLISKLGGLVDRRLYYMPFSRSLKLSEADTHMICDTLRECMANGGVLLVQPEHILSFQLMALECYITGKQDVGQRLLATNIQEMLGSARDIVDESDENFSVHFELIYTMGSQCSIELSPTRWLLVQQVLDIVRSIAPNISKQLVGSLECHSGCVPGGFPRIRILRPDAEMVLLERLAEYVCDHGLHGLQISRQPEGTRKAIYTYITKLKLTASEISAVEKSVFWAEATVAPLLLLRGLIAGGVLAFVFVQKRWRVNYGLTTVPRAPPTKLAVPYRAKDNPSPRSEFSHPDVVLALTSLCYYYGGLSDEDLFSALGHVMDSDQSDIEYQAWVRDSHALPLGFRQLQGINLKDRLQCVEELFPALRHGKSVIDYFLSHIVFPKEMKEFPLKLSASGWDMGKSKKQSGGAVTGFSGTNDSRCLLPLDVGHLDLQEQKHTNALVLEHILQPENGVVLLQSRDDVQLSDAEQLLSTTMSLSPPVQVILDVGAQILEMNNIQVAKTWLYKHGLTKEAAVFVNDNDEICVIDRNGRVELLRTSSFSNRLGSCLIFLDEAHTRGIDLQLPVHYRAAVTLGAGLTKDRLVQAAMRMRKLGKGQTIVFCISQEIKAKIEEVTSKREPASITTADVLHWAIWESNREIRRNMPLWAVQGERFVRQDALWQISKAGMSATLAEKFQEKEAQTIDERYRPRPTHNQPVHLLESSDDKLQSIANRCQEFDDLEFNSSTLQEEQERELSPEVEQERQVQRPPSATPAKHKLHEDVLTFAKLGLYVDGSPAYKPAFQAFEDSSAANDFECSQLLKDGKLLATVDFIQTTERQSGSSRISDNFQRSVQWILTNRVPNSDLVDRVLIVSPFEANRLIKTMTRSKGATLHIYKPRSNSGYDTLDHLQFYTVSAQSPPTIPRALAIQLDLFAGQLYISSYEDYLEICNFLGLSTKAVTQEMADQGWKQDATGFILCDDKGRVGGESGLKKSPVNFFQILMSKIRRNGESIVKTHIGGLLEGKLFQEGDFE